MKNKFETSLLESGDLMKRGAAFLADNVSRAIAVITLIIAALVLFTDVGFASFEAKSFTSTMAVMLLASYLMYFSMEDSGEKLGEESEEYKTSKARCLSFSEKVSGDMVIKLRSFCKRYSEEELEYRRTNLLLTLGFSDEEYKRYKAGEKFGKKAARAFRRIDRMKAIPLTPKTLLSKESVREKSELSNPEGKKLVSMLLKLIPTTLCTTLTVSIMLTTKENLSAATVIDGLFKISALLVVGFKGYTAGYSYAKRILPAWFETKARLLDAFLKENIK